MRCQERLRRGLEGVIKTVRRGLLSLATVGEREKAAGRDLQEASPSRTFAARFNRSLVLWVLLLLLQQLLLLPRRRPRPLPPGAPSAQSFKETLLRPSPVRLEGWTCSCGLESHAAAAD